MNIIGDVKGKNALILDDMIDTAGTIVQTAQACLDQRRFKYMGWMYPCGLIGPGPRTIARIFAQGNCGDEYDPSRWKRAAVCQTTSSFCRVSY